MSDGCLLESRICRENCPPSRATSKRFRMILLHEAQNNRLGIILLRKNRGVGVGSATCEGVPNSFGMRSYKSLDLKSPGMCTYEIRVGEGPIKLHSLVRPAWPGELSRSAANGKFTLAVQSRAAHSSPGRILLELPHSGLRPTLRRATRFRCVAKERGARMPRHRKSRRPRRRYVTPARRSDHPPPRRSDPVPNKNAQQGSPAHPTGGARDDQAGPGF